MSDFGSDFVVLTDEEGVDREFEHLDTAEYKNNTYMAFIPADESEDEEAELVILKLVDEGTDNEALVTVDDELELEEVFNIFMERIEEADLDESDEDDISDSDSDAE